MTPRDYVSSSWMALRGNPLRSLLTTLGIVFGIASLIAMMAIGNGASDRIDKLIQGFGSNTLTITSGAARSGGVRMGAGTKSSLSQRDAHAIAKEIYGVAYVAPQLNSTGQMVAANLNWSTSVTGAVPEYQEISQWPLATGRWFDAADERSAARVIILGDTVAKSLFPGVEALGQSMRVNRTTFTVIGVLSVKGQNMWGRDQDDTAFIPLNSLRRYLSRHQVEADAVSSIQVKASEGVSLDQMTEEISVLLRQRHRLAATAEDDFQVRNFAQIVTARNDTMRIMTSFLAVVAGIALLVGGIGIMNIMLVTVTERTKEIGLRMAVGATPKAVLWQFIIESAMLALAGGVLGIGLGFGGAQLAGNFTGIPTIVDTSSIVLATVSSVFTGVFFGYYPAWRASKLSPMEALRSE